MAHLRMLGLLVAWGAFWSLATNAFAQEGLRRLAEFGPVDNPSAAQQTYEKAVGELRKSGGLLLVPRQTLEATEAVPLQGSVRTPDPPAETKLWRDGAGVTVVAIDEQQRGRASAAADRHATSSARSAWPTATACPTGARTRC